MGTIEKSWPCRPLYLARVAAALLLLASLCACDPGAFNALQGDDGKSDSNTAGSGGSGTMSDASIAGVGGGSITPPATGLPTAGGGADAGSLDENLPRSATQLLAFTGGSSIALRWTSALDARRYEIFRNEAPVGTVMARVRSAVFPEKDGNGFIDELNVVPGAEYRYVVVAVDGQGAESRSDELLVKAPDQMTPQPSITFDTSGAPDLAGWLQGDGKRVLEVWYPKLVEVLALPGYAAPAAFSVTITSGSTKVDGTSIQWNADAARSAVADPDSSAELLSLAAQVVANRPAPSDWKVDWVKPRIGTWVLQHVVHQIDRSSAPSHGDHYYYWLVHGSYFLQWIAENKNEDFLREVTSNDDPDIFTRVIGSDVDTLWQEMTGVPLPGLIWFRLPPLLNLCVQAGTDIGIGSPNAAVFLTDCDKTYWAQWWGVRPNSDGTISLVNNGRCMEADGRNPSSKIWMAPCDEKASGQHWVRNELAGSLAVYGTFQCLDDPAASTTKGTQLQLWDCTGEEPQNVGLPY